VLSLTLQYKFSHIMIDEVEHSFVHSERVPLQSAGSGLKPIESLLSKVIDHKVDVTARFIVELELIEVRLLLR